jgi:hypothetical protein
MEPGQTKSRDDNILVPKPSVRWMTDQDLAQGTVLCVEKRLADAGQRERLSRRDRLRLGPLTTRPEGAFPSVKDLVLDIESPAEPRSKNFLPPSLVSFSSAFRAPGTL